MLKLCRICLETGANIPLFDGTDENSKLLTKIFICLSEKIVEIEGFPKNICSTCNDTLEEICKLIDKFKQTCHLLQNKLIVKLEHVDFSETSCDSRLNVEFKSDKLKQEFEDELNIEEQVDDIVVGKQKLKVETNIKNEIKVKHEVHKRPTKKKCVKSNSKLAASILEGEFIWIDDTWCIKSTKVTKSPSNKQKHDKVRKPQSIKLPKVKNTDIIHKLCDLCGEVFNSAQMLCTHKKKKHYQKPMKCPQCSVVLCSQYYLNRHIKRRHTDDKKFSCSKCEKAFAYKNELSSHIRSVHDKHLLPKKSYVCKICNKTYKCAKSLVVHDRSVHTGLRPAVCTICESSFYHEEYLREHMRLHTGETPFKCPVCDRGYAQSGNMKSHLRIHKKSEISAEILGKMRPSYLKLLKP